MSNGKRPILKLYREMLRAGSQFNDYNFRNYTVRRVREEFHRNATAPPEQVPALIEDAEKQLAMIKRQVTVGNLYSSGPHYMDKAGDKLMASAYEE